MNERIVKQRLQQVLRKVDFETETQRTITHRLEQELGVSLSQFKPLIKVGSQHRRPHRRANYRVCCCWVLTVASAVTPPRCWAVDDHPPCLPNLQDEIDAFLTEQDDLDDDADSDFEPEPAAAPPPAKKQKAAGGGAAPAPPAGEFVAQLAPERFACVRQYGSRTMVDVREFYEKEGSFQVRPLPPSWPAHGCRRPCADRRTAVAAACPGAACCSPGARAWRCRRRRGTRCSRSWGPSAQR